MGRVVTTRPRRNENRQDDRAKAVALDKNPMELLPTRELGLEGKSEVA